MLSAQVYLHDNQTKRWLHFNDPKTIVEARSIDEVEPTLKKAAQLVEERQLWSVGFVSYEAGPAFDAAMTVHPPGNLPLAWFALFNAPTIANPPAPANLKTLTWQPNQNKISYARAIQRIKTHIAHGNTYQVNYTLRMHTDFEGHAFDLFSAMANGQQCEYSAFIKTDHFAICSASPELFFDLHERQLTSRPMKGTAPRGLTAKEDLENAAWLHASEKNRAENLMIVDMVRNDMGRIAQIGTVEVANLFKIEKYPSVLQMTSTVKCKTTVSIPEIFKALFPCASITGAPKIRTMDIIHDLEKVPRGVYTGAIGFWTPTHRAQFNVAIRTAVLDLQTGKAEYGTGSGIIWDSEANDEYEECLIKTRVLSSQTTIGFDLLESLRWSPKDSYFLLNRHFDRLCASADYFNYPFDVSAVKNQLRIAEAAWDSTVKKVRLLLDTNGDIKIEAETINATEISIGPPQISNNETLSAALALAPINPKDVFLYHKTTQRTIYKKALANRPGLEHVLLWNTDDELTEFTTSNLVALVNGELVTPPVRCGLLPGTLREELLARGVIKERVIKVEEIGMLQDIWAVNSVRGWQKISLHSENAPQYNEDNLSVAEDTWTKPF